MNIRAAMHRVALLPLTAAALILPKAVLAVDPLHPLGRDVTIEIIVGNVISAVLGLLGTLSLAVFMWSGFVWMTAQGNADKIKVAQRNFVYATMGLLVCFGSYAMVRFVLQDVIFTALSPS